ncbi:hypothetical protein O6H91_21G063900 [Diphasiastrum complanatum]|uniref:Uncharacterized protein n=3 Tax=Diphasiastrum complanatum TaxID=34168 RepID=A0ACC2ALA1_DIPCM|nr:hypothetical protein O6H91_21G063900 [Diphasiastrum complanatum]
MVSIRKFGCRGGRVSGNGLKQMNEVSKSLDLGVELHSADASGDVNGEACGWKKCSVDLKVDTNHEKERGCTPIPSNNSMPPLSSSSRRLAAAQLKMCIQSAKKGQSKASGFCDEYIYDHLSGTPDVLSDEEMSEDVLGFASLQGQEDSNSESEAEVWATNMYFEKVFSNNEQEFNRVRLKPGVEAAPKERSQKSIRDHEEKAFQCASGNVGEQIPTTCCQAVEDCQRDVGIKTPILSQFSNRPMTNSKFFAGENVGPSRQRKRILDFCDEYIYDHLSGSLVRMSDEESIDDFSGMVRIKSDEGDSGSDAEIMESNAGSEKKPFVAEQDQMQICAAFKVENLSNFQKKIEFGDVDVGFQVEEPLMPTRNAEGKYCSKNGDSLNRADVPITEKERLLQIQESICNRFAKRGHSRILGSSDEYIYDSLSATANIPSDEDNDEHLSGSRTMRSEEDSNDLDTEIWATSRDSKKASCVEMEEKHAVSLDAKSPANIKSVLVDAGGSTQALTCLVKKNDTNLPATGSGRNNSILFWLIEADVVKENAEVQYLRKKDKKVMKEGKLTSKGVLCTCCDQLFTLSRFEAHAGSKLHRPAANMFLADGRSLVECQNQASQLLDLQ